MSLPPRAAAIRGDDYQHAVGWVAACEALCDPDVQSVSIEDAHGGHFDDVVTRHRSGPDVFIQVKSSNSGNVIVDGAWLPGWWTGSARDRDIAWAAKVTVIRDARASDMTSRAQDASIR